MISLNNSNSSISIQDANLIPIHEPEEKVLIFDVTSQYSIVKNMDYKLEMPKGGLDSMIAIGDKGSDYTFFDEPFNIGSNNPIKIKDLVKKIHNLTNSKSKLKIGAKKYRPNEIWKMQAENKFIINKVGWKPVVNFNQGLTNTIQWYKKFLQVYYNKKNPIWSD